MSKDFTKEELIGRKNSMLKELDTLLSSFIESPDSHLAKKASLLSYWMRTFTRYIRDEENFEPSRLKSYKRGDIVKINFGFNVGSEYGGLHYAIVIDKDNAHNSPVVTVIPLTSYKDGTELHPSDLFLGNEIYRSLKLKHDTISQNLQREKEEIQKMQSLIFALYHIIDDKLDTYSRDPNGHENVFSEANEYLETAQKVKQEYDKKEKENIDASQQLEKIGAEIKRMKIGSVALVTQITTVSKMRIYDPRNSRGVLSGVRLSPESLDKLNEKIKELYIF